MRDRIVKICFIVMWVVTLVSLMLGVYHKNIDEVALGLYYFLMSTIATYGIYKKK